MGSHVMRPWMLAVIALLCIWPCAYGEKRASPAETAWSVDFTYASGVLATGGVYTNITGQDDKLFLWSSNPAPVAIVAWDVSQTVSNFSATPLVTASNFTYAGVELAYFKYSTTDGSLFYMVTTDGYVLLVDPADLSDDASTNSASQAVVLAGAGPIIFLTNGTGGIFVSPNAANTYSTFQSSDFGSTENPSIVVPKTLGADDYVTDDGFGWMTSCYISEDYGYLFGTTKNNIWAFRVNASSGVPEMAMVFRDAWLPAENGACHYSLETDTFYMPMVNASIADDEGATFLLRIQNLTQLDTRSGVVYNESLTDLVTASAQQQTSSKRAAAAANVDLCLIIENDGSLLTGVNPYTVNVDEAGGQALILMAGVIGRVNLADMTVATPTIALSGGTVLGGGSEYYHDANSTLGNRVMMAYGSNTFWKVLIPTSCPNDCGESENPVTGACFAGVCVCNAGFHGEDCAGIDCTSDCGASLGQGNCTESGICQCGADWSFASNCTARQCPNNCYDNGRCDVSANYTCVCDALWTGSDCSIAAYTACNTFTNEKECVAKFGACGWCADTHKCVTGNLDGPYLGSCRAWYAGGKYQVGLLIAAIIVIVIWFLMLIVGISAAAPIDFVTASVLADSSLLSTDFLKEAYLRDERSAKTWKMFDLFQFISYYSFINVSFPTQMIQFSRYFNWANMMLPLPYGYEDNTTVHPGRLPTATGSSRFVLSRSILNAEQYANSVKVDTENIFYGTLFWFAMFSCAVLLVYLIYALIMWLCLRKKEPFIGTLLVQKVFHILVRLVLIGMIPLNFTAAWHIRQGSRPHNGTIAAAIAVIIIFGILPIVFNAVVVWGKSKELIFLFLKLRFGALYGVYHYQKARFNLVVLIKKLAVALLLGFIASNSDKQGKYVYAQVFTIVAVFVIYAIVAVIIRAYLDQVHLLLDVVMSLLFALAFGIAVLHKGSPSTAGQVVWGVCLIIVWVACVIAFIHSWWNMQGRNTHPSVLCGPKYGGAEDATNDNEDELDAAVQIRNKKEKEAALAGAMPAAHKQAAAHAEPEEDEVDSSLQSSSEQEEDEDESSEASSSSSSESSEEESSE